MKKKALMTASVASMIDLFNMDNIQILQQMGYEVHVAANFKEGNITSDERVKEFRRELESDGIATYHIPIPRSIFKIWSILSSYFQMKRLCKREGYALIHTQSPIGGVVSRLAAASQRKSGTSVIYTAHGFHFFKGASKKNWLIFYPVEKFLARYTDVLITINQEDYKRAKKFPAKKVCYVHGVGIDTKCFSVPKNNSILTREEFDLKKDDYVVLSVGQLSKRKNQEVVIKAMALIEDKSIKYLVVGVGENETKYKELIKKLNLENRVILAGYRSDIGRLLTCVDCFAFPSLQEGLPVSLMEAMAAGLPVVCSDVRGNRDLIKDGVNGKLLDPFDISGFANAIKEYKNNPRLAARYGGLAQKRVKSFDNCVVRKEMEKLYLDLCRKNI